MSELEQLQCAITPRRADNFPGWRQQVVLVGNSKVRGYMIIKPWGYGIWENMQRVLDGMLKNTLCNV